MTDPTRRYLLDDERGRFEVRVSTDGTANVARLLIDGEQVAEQKVWRVGDATLRADALGDATVKVSWWWTDRPYACVLVDKRAGVAGRPVKVPFEPPRGTRAHRTWQLQQDHAGLYASRHVAIAVARTLGALLGISALLVALLPRVDLSWLPRPDLGKPSWWPDVSLWGWLPDVDLAAPEWLRPVLRSAKFWVPVLVAIVVAANEYERRRKQTDSEPPDKNPPGS